jgi:hypothetical protein
MAGEHLAMDATNPIDHYVRGIPVTVDGRVCVFPPVADDEDAFSNGFSEGFA